MYAGNNNLLLTLLQYLHSIYKIFYFMDKYGIF